MAIEGQRSEAFRSGGCSTKVNYCGHQDQQEQVQQNGKPVRPRQLASAGEHHATAPSHDRVSGDGLGDDRRDPSKEQEAIHAFHDQLWQATHPSNSPRIVLLVGPSQLTAVQVSNDLENAVPLSDPARNTKVHLPNSYSINNRVT